MMEVTEIRQWLDSIPADAYVGVDEGGLCLRAVQGTELTGDYLEIGGIPEEIENA